MDKNCNRHLPKYKYMALRTQNAKPSITLSSVLIVMEILISRNYYVETVLYGVLINQWNT